MNRKDRAPDPITGRVPLELASGRLVYDATMAHDLLCLGLSIRDKDIQETIRLGRDAVITYGRKIRVTSTRHYDGAYEVEEP